MARLQTAGYDQYEVSNWARGSAFACRHNLLYWRNQEWIGVGPGAHSHLRYPLSARLQNELPQDLCDPASPERTGRSNAGQAAVRWSNRKGVQGYMKRIENGSTPVDFHEELSAAVSMGETMMLGLRLVQEGVSFARFEEMHGQPLRAAFGSTLDRLQVAGLLESNEERVCLTPRGLLIGNRVFSEFVA
jgi:oxygen-independent coproporphyrinogen-3 oxidase